MTQTQLIDYFQRARKNSEVAVIEGVQALKHAVRFQANIEKIVTSNKDQLAAFLTELAPDIRDTVLTDTEIVDESVFAKLSPQPPRGDRAWPVVRLPKRCPYQKTAPHRCPQYE